ncbi:hypothetical protein Aperf_G00000020278 [Anoplocephala perfoliata]
MDHLDEEISTTLQHGNLPVNLIHSGASSDECSEEEEEHGNLEFNGEREDQVGSSSEDEVHSKGMPVTAESPIGSEEEESDYEEPKLNGASASPPIDEESQDAVEIGGTPTHVEDAKQEEEDEEESTRCLKCDELINSGEKVNGSSSPPPHFHANCFRCAHCDSLITDEDFELIDGMPYCRLHSAHLSSGDTANEEVDVPAAKQEIPDVESPKSVRAENADDQELHHESPRVDDVLPPTGSAKRLVEQWSNIEAHKANRSTPSSAQLDSAPQYAPNTAKTIAAKFSAGITDDHPSPKTSIEPTEHLPTQGQARGLIAKFSAMHA